MCFTYLTRDNADFLVDRYSERKDAQNKALNMGVSKLPL